MILPYLIWQNKFINNIKYTFTKYYLQTKSIIASLFFPARDIKNWLQSDTKEPNQPGIDPSQACLDSHTIFFEFEYILYIWINWTCDELQCTTHCTKSQTFNEGMLSHRSLTFLLQRLATLNIRKWCHRLYLRQSRQGVAKATTAMECWPRTIVSKSAKSYADVPYQSKCQRACYL